MQADTATRALLALILVCLVILIAQGGLGGGSDEPGWGRFSVTGMRAGAPVLIRTDTVTGEVWKLELRGGGNKWVAFKEPVAEQPQASAARESSQPAVAAATTTREVIEPPGAPARPGNPPRPTAASLAALAEYAKQPADVSDIDTYATALGRDALPADMRAWAAKQLGQIDDPKSTDALLGVLDDPEPVVVSAALRALTGRGDDRVKAAALKATSHADDAVQSAAQATLASLE